MVVGFGRVGNMSLGGNELVLNGAKKGLTVGGGIVFFVDGRMVQGLKELIQ